MPRDASDEEQLLGANTQGSAIFTYNIRDFTALGTCYPRHSGIIVAYQKSMSLNETIHALDRILRETGADDRVGQIRWLNTGEDKQIPVSCIAGSGLHYLCPFLDEYSSSPTHQSSSKCKFPIMVSGLKPHHHMRTPL